MVAATCAGDILRAQRQMTKIIAPMAARGPSKIELLRRRAAAEPHLASCPLLVFWATFSSAPLWADLAWMHFRR